MCQGRRCPPLETFRQGERCSPLDSLCQQGCCSPLLETQSQRDCAPLDTPPFVQWLSILLPHAGYAPARTGKTGTEIRPDGGQISVPVFVQRRLGKAYAEALQNHRSWLEIFVLECENRLSQTPISGIIKQSNSLTEVPLMVISYNKLWKLLIDRKMSKADLRRAAGIAPNTMTKLNRDEEVTLETLGKICAVLDVNICLQPPV